MSTFSEDKIKNAFVAEELDFFGEYLVDMFISEIEDKDLVLTGNLINSFEYRTDKTAQKLVLSFYSYGRMHDLKSRNNLIFESADTNALVWGIKKRKPRQKNRDKRWYAKSFYGSLPRFTSKLMYGFSDEARNEIISQLKKLENLNIKVHNK